MGDITLEVGGRVRLLLDVDAVTSHVQEGVVEALTFEGPRLAWITLRADRGDRSGRLRTFNAARVAWWEPAPGDAEETGRSGA